MTAQIDVATGVVVGVDGSEESKRALRWGAIVAASYGADVRAVAAWQFPNVVGWSTAPSDWTLQQDMEKCLTETVNDVFGEQRPASLSLVVREGHPAEVLIAESKQASMLVVGSRGHGGFAGLLLGSVSANVAERARCPVLVVHGDLPPPELVS